MKTFVIIICLLFAGFYVKSQIGVGSKQSHGTGKFMPQPSPVLSRAEVDNDSPSEEAFDRAGWKPVDRAAAEAFGSLSKDVHCNLAWLQEVRSMQPGAQIKASRVLGRQGVCTWYAMRIVGPGGNVLSEFQRPGPRGSKPSDY